MSARMRTHTPSCILRHSPFVPALRWAVLSDHRTRTAAVRALHWLSQMFTHAPQTPARPLSERCSAWRSLLSMNSWMDRLITRGYTLQFAGPPPPFNGVLETVMTSQTETAALITELTELVKKGAISPIPPGEESEGFYSRYFLVPKKTGGMRPILDLSVFNKRIMKRPFHMLTIKHVLECVRPGDWFISV